MKISGQRYKKFSLFLCMLLMVLGIGGCAGSGNEERYSPDTIATSQNTSDQEESEQIKENAESAESTENAEKTESIESVESTADIESTENADSPVEGKNEEDQGTVSEEKTSEEASADMLQTEDSVEYGEAYTSKDEVALYIHLYQELPPNYITKKEAQKLGWSGGSLEEYAPGKSIGGDKFGNYEGNLPDKKGRKYTECDIDTKGASKRGAKRIVFSNDGLIYYTEDHYESFELLYGEE